MSSNNFRRSNVNAKTLQITDPARSSFPLGHKNELSIPFGKIVPVSHRVLMATDTFQGSISPNFHLEKIATPSIGPVRLDTHTFIVNFRRINRDMRKNLENGVNFFPSFRMSDFVERFVLRLCSYADFGSVTSYTTWQQFSDALFAKYQYQDINQHWSSLFCLAMVDVTCESLFNILCIVRDGDDSVKRQYSEMYYQLDSIEYLYRYYVDLRKRFPSIVSADTTLSNDNDPRIIFEHFMPLYLKPIFGPSSLFDYLGYPIYTQYSKVSQWYRLPQTLEQTENGVTRVSRYDAQGSNDWASVYSGDFTNFRFRQNSPFAALFSAKVFDYIDRRPVTQNLEPKIISVPMLNDFSELPLRAYYAVWYDYLRNWHVEERKHVLDPDDFSNSSLMFASTSPVAVKSFSVYQVLARDLLFCTLNTRMYNSDFLTSIQTDADFRHVYSPVFASGSSSGNVQPGVKAPSQPNPSNVEAVRLQDGLDTIYEYFPADFQGTNIGLNYYNVMYQDLQTMRRAGMLERWLARNYYYPDTYVGRLQARFGVRPADYEILVSNYIGGSETFIQGSELVANMSTSESVVGSRNLKADVSLKDSFSGTVSDYSYLISVVSTVPVVSYDVLHPSVRTVDFVDFPQPEFATDTRVEARTCDFLRGFEVKPFIGYVPRYYMFRTSADETHGRYLTDYRVYNWFRDSYSMSLTDNEFTLSPYSLRVHLPLDAFIGLSEFDDFAYGDCDCELAINRPLPAAIEVI